jgi:hypothetical protein
MRPLRVLVKLDQCNLVGDLTFDEAEVINKIAAERVEAWQYLESVPEGHSVRLMKIGRQMLKNRTIELTFKQPETENLVKRVDRPEETDENSPADAEPFGSDEDYLEDVNAALEDGNENSGSGSQTDETESKETPVGMEMHVIANRR